MSVSLMRCLAAGACLVAPLHALSQVPSFNNSQFVFTERRSASSAFDSSWDLVIGATNLTPAGPGTTAFADHLGSLPNITLNHVTGQQFPNQYAARSIYAGETGRWAINATNAAGTSTVLTHVLDDVRDLPLLTGVSVSGPALAPHVTWNPVDHLLFPSFCGGPAFPACGLGQDIYQYQVEVRQVTGTPGNAVPITFTSATMPTASLIAGVLTPTVTAFDIPVGVMTAGNEYIIGVRFTHLDMEQVGPTQLQFFAENRSTSYYVAAPIPEPETYAMLLAGLALLGFQARRRARRGYT